MGGFKCPIGKSHNSRKTPKNGPLLPVTLESLCESGINVSFQKKKKNFSSASASIYSPPRGAPSLLASVEAGCPYSVRALIRMSVGKIIAKQQAVRFRAWTP